jgi:hypothetical protein
MKSTMTELENMYGEIGLVKNRDGSGLSYLTYSTGSVFFVKDSDLIVMMRFFNKEIHTEKGFHVGDSVEKMKKLYGNPESVNMDYANQFGYGEYIYSFENYNVTFEFNVINGYESDTINGISVYMK